MKLNSAPVIWSLFFVVSLLILALIANVYIEPREITINETQARTIGLKIAKNERVDNRVNMVDWLNEDKHSTLGIAHFIWYPANEYNAQMSFNGLLEHMAQSTTLPDWLISVKYPPWHSKADYLLPKYDVFKRRLSYFLRDSVVEQTQYLIFSLESRLPKILKIIKSPFARMHAYENFYHISAQKNGVYTLVDYFIFMGDGALISDQYNNQGWGLLQVLDNMKGSSDNLLQEFLKSSDLLLRRRIANAPNDESKQLPNWKKRTQTYVEL